MAGGLVAQPGMALLPCHQWSRGATACSDPFPARFRGLYYDHKRAEGKPHNVADLIANTLQ